MERAACLPELIAGERITLRRWSAANVELLGVAVQASTEHLRPWMPWIAQEPLTLGERTALARKARTRRREEAETSCSASFSGIASWAAAGSPPHRALSASSATGLIPRTCARALRPGSPLLTGAAFGVPAIERVDTHHDKANKASARIPATLGFNLIRQQRAEPRAPAEVGVECVWRMCRDDWERSGGPERPVLRRCGPRQEGCGAGVST